MKKTVILLFMLTMLLFQKVLGQQASANGSHNLVIKTDGTLWAWGLNSSGQLGDGTNTDKNTPTQIGTAKDWKSVAAGQTNSFAIKFDGTLWSWGNNTSGQLGDGTTVNKNTPEKIGTATDWNIIVASGNHTVAIKSNGSLWAWGANSVGQLGDGTTVNKSIPTRIGTATDWKSIVVGISHTVAIKGDGSLWAWGVNNLGQLGDGTSVNKNVPTRIGTAVDWKNITSSLHHTVALKTDGSLWAWGANNLGQLGDGAKVNQLIPTKIGVDTDWKTITAGNSNSFAIKLDGSLWAWGHNINGQLGDGTTVDKIVPTRIGTSIDWKFIAAGSGHTLALKNDGFLFTWGQNNSGQIGDGITGTKNTPIQIGKAVDWRVVVAGSSHSLAIKKDGSLWAWGSNSNGQLGDGTQIAKNIPIQIGSATDWKTVVAGRFSTLALKTDGTLWFWGFNEVGVNITRPTQIGTATDWKIISAGSIFNVAIKTDGSLWAWGLNSSGQLGDGTTVNKSMPTQIGTATDWKNVTASTNHTLAIKTDGSLWAWGANLVGQLGDGTTTNKNAPTKIGVNTSWKDIATNLNGGNFALDIDGALWSWGFNASGQLGDGTIINKNIPTQISTITNWTTIAAGLAHTLRLKSDGSLWSWGANNVGQLGDGSITNRFIPAQMGMAYDWSTIAAGSSHSLAIKTDGSLWAWGGNGTGQLGDGEGFYPAPQNIDFNIDGEPITSVTIGNQIWTNKNLAVVTYSDGTPIPQVTDPTAWKNLTTGAWCYAENNPINGDRYGKLYNWYAVAGIWDEASKTDVSKRKKLAPVGWKVPNDADWDTLIDYLGGSAIAGGKMKLAGTTQWLPPNVGADNTSGFTGLPGGFRHNDASFNNYGCGYWWSSTQSLNQNHTFYSLCYGTGSIVKSNGYENVNGLSIRCVRDSITQVKIGDHMDGGIIGHIFQPGDFGYIAGEINGIIVAPQDLSELFIWGPYNPTEYAKNFTSISTEIGKGKINSNTILSVATQTNADYPAAAAANNYVNENFNDWFLPSSGELMILKKNLFDNDKGNFVNETYWSSSVMQNYVGALAPMFNTVNGICGCAVFERYRVRPIRYFSLSTTTTLAPTGNTTQTLCSNSTVASLTAIGTAIKWYAASTGGTALASSTLLNNSATYYATQTVNGVESAGRFAVTVSIPKLSFIPSLTNVALGSNASFTGSSISGSATFQWQSNINDIGWINLPNNTTYSGSNTNKLTINNIKVSNHMQEFRLIATAGSCIDTSNVVSMSVNYTLPVELISFEAKLKNQDQVNLNWETSSELNNNYFTIAKSSDGKRFNKLTTIPSKGDGGIYSAVDQNPYSGTTYYQLSQTDKDGKTEELGIKAVNISLANTQKIMIYPNPTQNEVKLSFAREFYTTAKLIDLQGKILQKKSISINDTELVFDLKALDAGSYLIQLEGKGMNVQKVVKE